MKPVTQWEVASLNHSDSRWAVERSVINDEGKYQLERHRATYSLFERAQQMAEQLNKEDK
jgi:hypothetical protein